MPSQSDGEWVNVVFYAVLGIGGYFLVDKLAMLAWNVIQQLWPAFVLLTATIAGVFCFWRVASLLRPEPTFRCDVNLDKLDDESLDEETVPPTEPAVQSVPTPQEPPKRKLEIDVEGLLSTLLHSARNLIPEEVYILEKNQYVLKKFVPLGEVRPQLFYIRECKPESLEHTFVVHSIAHKLKQCLDDVRTYATQKPDLVFTFDDEEYALEIETPLFLKKKHNRLVAKAKTNNTAYGKRWWIVTTSSAYQRSFRKYGKVLRRNQIDNWLQKLLPE